MNRVCKVCGKAYEVPNWKVPPTKHRCRECTLKYHREWAKKRREKGLPSSGTVMPKSYFKEYNKSYNQLPEVKRKQSSLAKQRYQDPAERVKINARIAARRAVKVGIITKQPCAKCGSIKVEAHHEDYNKPLVVIWLCRQHHDEIHLKANPQQ